MDKVIFADTWQKFFAGFDLRSFDDFFDHPATKTAPENTKRTASKLVLGEGEERKVFFIKRFHNSTCKDTLFGLRNFGTFCSQAACEWKNAKMLLDNGIETYRPVCYGERTWCGIERKSFVVSENLTGEALTDFVGRNWQNLNRQQKEKIIVDMAVFVRRIHEKKFSPLDLYVWHIFLKENKASGGWEFAILDLHRMSHNVKNKNHQLENLGRLFYSMAERYFDEGLKQLFIQSYAGNDYAGDIKTLTAQIKRYSDKLSARRKLKPY